MNNIPKGGGRESSRQSIRSIILYTGQRGGYGGRTKIKKKDGFTRNGQLIDERLVFFCLGVFCCGFYLVDILFFFKRKKRESMTGLFSPHPLSTLLFDYLFNTHLIVNCVYSSAFRSNHMVG
ncbi:hypothetical protein CI102_3734 [Trichoderma harzianum]|uniref:Transmembrane protein n=1 Tax=Trichoderma harzianum CBS 226.95 TaxID=983964 RepID=A0A2T4AVR3_TRIHA|nr:hypothetical protein M431DRAFT_204978 [Trichoderma harzianum CBS 226.95]PKK51135.1 hypothetical protein CI102_3734 [Trichoderma harzianum]PTB61163.1 hypothetical protein M431DRAFT_204978 [Trichoderma harzianum CBS 226.95]